MYLYTMNSPRFCVIFSTTERSLSYFLCIILYTRFSPFDDAIFYFNLKFFLLSLLAFIIYFSLLLKFLSTSVL